MQEKKRGLYTVTILFQLPFIEMIYRDSMFSNNKPNSLIAMNRYIDMNDAFLMEWTKRREISILIFGSKNYYYYYLFNHIHLGNSQRYIFVFPINILSIIYFYISIRLFYK